MATYVGFYTFNAGFLSELTAKIRNGELQPGQPVEPMATKVREFLQKLPNGCKLIGSYTAAGQSIDQPEEHRLPSVIIVETDDPSHLLFITQYYSGYLSFVFHPYNPVSRA
jgi:hypothetical protein